MLHHMRSPGKGAIDSDAFSAVETSLKKLYGTMVVPVMGTGATDMAFLREKGVTLISAGLDEVPMVYKNIHEVMAAQKDLVTILGQFDPKLVKMAPSGERPED